MSSSRKHLTLAAVFLDRDGMLNQEVNHVSSEDQLELIEGFGEAVRRSNQAGLLAVVITNPSVIARGGCTEAELDRIHDKLETLLQAADSKLSLRFRQSTRNRNVGYSAN